MQGFLVDECTGPRVAQWLREKGYDVFSVYEQARGISDQEVLKKALDEHRILITNDKDFGEMIFRQQWQHSGVLFLRLEDERATNKIAVLAQFLKHHAHLLQGQFIVITEKTVRISKTPTNQ